MDFKNDFPGCNKLANELRDVFGNGVRLIKASEGSQEFTSKTALSIEPMVAVCPYPLPKRQHQKYVLFPGYVTSRTGGERHYISAPTLADLYQVDFQQCSVFVREESDRMNRLAIEAMAGRGLVGLYPRADGEYFLSNGVGL